MTNKEKQSIIGKKLIALYKEKAENEDQAIFISEQIAENQRKLEQVENCKDNFYQSPYLKEMKNTFDDFLESCDSIFKIK